MARMGEFEVCNLRTLCKYPSLLSEFKEIYGLMIDIMKDMYVVMLTRDLFLNRGENFDLLCEKTSTLTQSAYYFKKVLPRVSGKP